MTIEEIKTAILNLDQKEQRRLLMEVLPEVLPKVCTDKACLTIIRDFNNEENSRSYQEQHMDGL